MKKRVQKSLGMFNFTSEVQKIATSERSEDESKDCCGSKMMEKRKVVKAGRRQAGCRRIYKPTKRGTGKGGELMESQPEPGNCPQMQESRK